MYCLVTSVLHCTPKSFVKFEVAIKILSRVININLKEQDCQNENITDIS